MLLLMLLLLDRDAELVSDEELEVMVEDAAEDELGLDSALELDKLELELDPALVVELAMLEDEIELAVLENKLPLENELLLELKALLLEGLLALEPLLVTLDDRDEVLDTLTLELPELSRAEDVLELDSTEDDLELDRAEEVFEVAIDELFVHRESDGNPPWPAEDGPTTG
jgi:hypothetical protein